MSGAVAASAKGATFLILLQVGSRALTFALNQILLRYLSPETLGLSARLDLFSNTALYFARESLRVALQRHPGSIQAVVNFSYLSILLGVPLTCGLAALYLRAEAAPGADAPFLPESVRAYGLASVVELLSEPCFVAAQQKLLYKVRAAAESAATVAKCLATCGTAVWASRSGIDAGVLPFAVGQVVYSVLLLGVYLPRMYPVARREGFSLLPTRIQSKDPNEYILSLFSRPLFALSVSMYFQSSIKYVLTQADSLLIASMATLAEQGEYALASNYGGLIARMLFQPIEESSRNLFAKLCAPISPPPPSPSPPHPPQDPPQTSPRTASSPPSKPRRSRAALRQARTTLHLVLKSYLVLSLPLATLGPAGAPLLLRLVAGPRWASSQGPAVLAAYCFYIPLLALNGVSEAFVAAAAGGPALWAQAAAMLAVTAAFAAAVWVCIVLVGWGASGLVLANGVNMALRIAFNAAFIARFFGEEGVRLDFLGVLPSAMSVAAATAVPPLLKVSEGALGAYGLVGELVRVGAVGVVFCGVLAILERDFLLQCYRVVRPAPREDEKK
ncbi:Rft protein-domain-containing protein [Lineolata rhizophorae]|uniref:Man(5)GlcNAc(2)-PP-dolichol translocation protein RFT1 n=1 Tax=Lineolata rhizophorae TaxID=578093 RepID=A0A6A6P0U6_9PEZI|nr:Rft protein-domain-containing protein [Lineolata rhizophorae]